MPTDVYLPIVCDRCSRPVKYVWSDGEGLRFSDGPHEGARRGRGAGVVQHESLRQQHVPVGTSRGTDVLEATEHGEMNRYRFACAGRKHPKYERVATTETIISAYITAMSAGAPTIRMRDLQSAR